MGNLFGDRAFRGVFLIRSVSSQCGADANERPTRSADVRKQLRDKAEAVRREQTERAVRTLEREDGLSAAKREIVEQLGVRLTNAVLAHPESVLDSRGPETARAVAELLELDGPAD